MKSDQGYSWSKQPERGSRRTKAERAAQYRTPHHFDEQFWPINAMLFVFACVVAAVIVTAGLKEGRFIDPRLDPQPLLMNAFFHLGALLAVVLVLLFTVLLL